MLAGTGRLSTPGVPHSCRAEANRPIAIHVFRRPKTARSCVLRRHRWSRSWPCGGLSICRLSYSFAFPKIILNPTSVCARTSTRRHSTDRRVAVETTYRCPTSISLASTICARAIKGSWAQEIFMKTDAEIRRDVESELQWDPSIDDGEIGVIVNGGVVTLTGDVGHYQGKCAAEDITKRVSGVRAIANDIQVKIPMSGIRTDTEIAEAAANALRWNFSLADTQV